MSKRVLSGPLMNLLRVTAGLNPEGKSSWIGGGVGSLGSLVAANLALREHTPLQHVAAAARIRQS